MFSLELEIARWRIALGAAGLPLETVDELESHLREEIERHRRDGHDEPQALALALRRIGDVATLRREFVRGDPSLESGIRRTLSRIRSGNVRAVEINVLAVTGAVFGLLGLYQLHRFAVVIVPLLMTRLGATEVNYMCRAAAMTVVCLLVLRSCWRYLRSHEMAAARGLVAFHLFMGWSLADNCFRVFVLRRLLAPDEVHLWRFAFAAAAAIVVGGLWWRWMRRLARLASGGSSAEPRPQIQ